MRENQSRIESKSIDITPALARFTQNNGPLILVAAVLLFIFSGIGVSKLKVENSFIEYFDESTDIYQGMLAIDRNMGGTTPLDIIIDMSPSNPFDSPAYWFTSDKMQELIDIHNFLDELPETGKVLSLATLLGIAYELNEGEALNSIELGVLYNKIPDDYKETLLR
ncbi:MAG: efflux RND transporter permease subunit, partial [Pseudomonadales bacterium]